MAANGTASQSSHHLKMSNWIIRAAVAFVFISSGLEKFDIGPGQEWIRVRQDRPRRLVPIFHGRPGDRRWSASDDSVCRESLRRTAGFVHGRRHCLSPLHPW